MSATNSLSLISSFIFSIATAFIAAIKSFCIAEDVPLKTDDFLK